MGDHASQLQSADISRRTVFHYFAYGVALLGTTSASFSSQQNRYVSNEGGDDSNSGSIHAPFKTIARAIASVPDKAADYNVVVMPGTYDEQVVINKGGNRTGYFTLRSYTPRRALIRSPASTYSAINIVKDFATVDGFDVKAGGGGHGIEATFLDGDSRNRGPHHIRIVNNVCHDNPGSGIGVAYGDFYTIEGNQCYNNCHTNDYQGSGISIYAARAVSDRSSGFRIFVCRNICSRNEIISLGGSSKSPHSDGNGIIIDDFHNSQLRHPAGVYAFKTLVENNLLHCNGGKGIQIFLSDNVLIRNNTSYHNNRDSLISGSWRGELSNITSSNNIWINNIAVADTSSDHRNTAICVQTESKEGNRNVVWRNNLTFNGRQGDESIFVEKDHLNSIEGRNFNNLLGIDPIFVRGDDNLLHADFHIQLNSPAADAGTDAFGVAKNDLDGRMRVSGSQIDIGAYEIQKV
jgi:Protein of unknown function (DUF1565)